MTGLKGKLNPTPFIGFDKKPVQHYKGIRAMSDTDLHEQLLFILQQAVPGAVPGGKKLRVLDLGCGEGAFSQRLFDAGFDVTAIDLNKEAFRAKGPEFTVLDLNDNSQKENFVSSRKGKFDVIFAAEVIEHLKDPWEFVAFLKQLCGEGTEIFITTPNFASWWGRFIFLFSGELWGFDPAAWVDPGHINPVSATELSHILAANGLKLNNIYPCGKLPLVWLFNWKRALISLLMLALHPFLKGSRNGWALCFHSTAQKQ